MKKKIICPCCNHVIELETYYSQHKEEILSRYKERMKDPAYAEYRRKIALQSYHKHKKLKATHE